MHEVCPRVVLKTTIYILHACINSISYYMCFYNVLKSKRGNFLLRLVLTNVCVREHQIVLMLDMKLFSEFWNLPQFLIPSKVCSVNWKVNFFNLKVTENLGIFFFLHINRFF